MSYIVLARKYRPQTFDEVYGQEHVTTILKNAIKTNRLAHGFLFTGTRGVGKTSMARILAKSLNCMEGSSSTPCGVCENCLEITAGISADVIEIDGASNTGIDNIRDLQKELMYATSKSLYKIYIIDEVHMLSKFAFNALLKTLEEPPAQVIFIFATTEPQKVPITIISRCQRYDFKRIPIDLIVKQLKYICKEEKIDIEEEAFYIIAKKAEGSMRDALTLTDQLIATNIGHIATNDVLSLFGIVHSDVYHKITEYIYRKETGAIISLIHNLLDKGNDLQEFLGGYLDYLRNLLLIKTGVPLPELPVSLREEYEKMKTMFEEDTILYLMSVLIKTKTEVKYFSNPILLVETTFIKLSKMEEMKSISEMLKTWHKQPTEPAVEKPIRTAPRPAPYVEKKPSTETVKEPTYKPPHYEKMTKEVYAKEENRLISSLMRVRPVTANHLKGSKLIKVVENNLFFVTDTELANEMLTKERVQLATFLSKFFDMKLGVSFTYQEPEEEKKSNKKQANYQPTLKDIQDKSPNLAKFIELSGATITPIRKRE